MGTVGCTSPDLDCLLGISNNSHQSPSVKYRTFQMDPGILKTATLLVLMSIIEGSFSRPQSNTNVRTSDCGRSYCEQVANYPSKTILKLLDKTDILPGTFDSIERQGKRSLREEYSSNIKSKKENFNLINLIKR